MTEIDDAIASPSLSGLIQAGHSLCGASGAIGAVCLERASRRLESFGMTAESPAAQKAEAIGMQAALVEVSRESFAAVGHDTERSALSDA